jgi:hypothetical protein
MWQLPQKEMAHTTYNDIKATREEVKQNWVIHAQAFDMLADRAHRDAPVATYKLHTTNGGNDCRLCLVARDRAAGTIPYYRVHGDLVKE